jgi:hypothetical protein
MAAASVIPASVCAVVLPTPVGASKVSEIRNERMG